MVPDRAAARAHRLRHALVHVARGEGHPFDGHPREVHARRPALLVQEAELLVVDRGVVEVVVVVAPREHRRDGERLEGGELEIERHLVPVPLALVELPEEERLALGRRRRIFDDGVLGVGAGVVRVDPAEGRHVLEARQQPLGGRGVEGCLAEELVALGHLAMLAAVPPLPAGSQRERHGLRDLRPAVEVEVLAPEAPLAVPSGIRLHDPVVSTELTNVITLLSSFRSKIRYLAESVSGRKGRLTTLRLPRSTCTRPSRFSSGSTRSGLVNLIECGRNESFCSLRLYEKLPFTRVRMGRFTPPPSETVCAMLLGATEIWPVGIAAASAQPVGLPKQGLSTRMRRSPFSKTDIV